MPKSRKWAAMTEEITTLAHLRERILGWKKAGETIALVPTMGALHAGHLALMEAAKAHAARVVVSIFVNPTQFGPKEDFARYPRPLTEDLRLLCSAGIHAVWMPTVTEMYPHGFATTVHVAGVSEGMEGAIRPGHFDGVATVVAKLLMQVEPEVALFGEKDYQQLCLIKRLVNDLDIKTKIIQVVTKRSVDGLALSSRNQYLNESERAIAPKLYAILREIAAQLVSAKEAVGPVLTRAEKTILAAGFSRVDYLALRAADTLAPITQYDAATPSRLLVAAHLGTTRLIDNIAVNEEC